MTAAPTANPRKVQRKRASVRMGVPNADWSERELYDRARWENQQIRHTRSHAPRYWFLGKVLLALQQQVKPGRWEAWCKKHKIQRDRWKRGRLLALAFDSADQVAELPILAAVDRARERLGLPPRPTSTDGKIRRWLKEANERVRSRLNELPSVASPGDLRPLIAELTCSLVELDRACAAAAQEGGP